jgi:hypothetical protein
MTTPRQADLKEGSTIDGCKNCSGVGSFDNEVFSSAEFVIKGSYKRRLKSGGNGLRGYGPFWITPLTLPKKAEISGCWGLQLRNGGQA